MSFASKNLVYLAWILKWDIGTNVDGLVLDADLPVVCKNQLIVSV